MRKVGHEAAKAFLQKRYYKNKHTEVTGLSLWLHCTRVAMHYREGVCLSLAGYMTDVTVDRVHAVLYELGCPFRFRRLQGTLNFAGEVITPETVVWVSKSSSNLYKILQHWPEEEELRYENKSTGTG